jgi:hypothetical protein
VLDVSCFGFVSGLEKEKNWDLIGAIFFFSFFFSICQIDPAVAIVLFLDYFLYVGLGCWFCCFYISFIFFLSGALGRRDICMVFNGLVLQ